VSLSFSDFIEIGNEAVDFRKLYDHFGFSYTRSGGSTQCKCPFHGRDRHPSARIYEDTNSWFCFTCGFSRTPVYFFKDIVEKPLTDAVFEFFTIFRLDIICHRPDLLNEDFSLTAIKKAHFSHIVESAESPLEVTSITLPKPGNTRVEHVFSKAVLGKVDTSVFYKETKGIWDLHYSAPSFYSIYMEFTSHLNRIVSPAATETDCVNFNNFLATLDSRLRNFI